jgi:hypothetical protein
MVQIITTVLQTVEKARSGNLGKNYGNKNSSERNKWNTQNNNIKQENTYADLHGYLLGCVAMQFGDRYQRLLVRGIGSNTYEMMYPKAHKRPDSERDTGFTKKGVMYDDLKA